MSEPLNHSTSWQAIQRQLQRYRPLMGKVAIGGALLISLLLALMMASLVQPKTVCVVVGGGVMLAVLLTRPTLVLAVLAYGLYLVPPGSLVLGIRVPQYYQILMPVGLLSALVPVVRGRKLSLGLEETLIPLALLGSMWISTVLGGEVQSGTFFVKAFVVPVGAYWLLRLQADRLGGMEVLFRRMLACYAVYTAILLAEQVVGSRFIYGSGEQVTGEEMDLGGSAAYMRAAVAAILFPLVLMQAVRAPSKREQWLWLGLAIAPAAQVVFNVERSGVIGMALGIMVLLLYRRAHRVVVPVVVLGLLLGLYGWQTSYQALGRIRNKAPVEYRHAYWTVAWGLLQSDRWPKAFGFGFNGYQEVVSDLLGSSPDTVPDITVERTDRSTLQDVRAWFEAEGMRRAHNDLLSFPLEFGIVGSVLMGAGLVAVGLHWGRVYRAGRRGDVSAMDWSVAMAASCAAWFVNVFTHNLYILIQVSLTLAPILALLVMLSRRDARQRQQTGLAAAPAAPKRGPLGTYP